MRDAWIQPATAEQVALFAKQRGIGEAAAKETLERLRERQILARRGRTPTATAMSRRSGSS